MTHPRTGWALAVLLLAPAGLPAQGLAQRSVTGGVEALRYGFGDFFGARSLSQWALPVGTVLPMGQFTLDVGGNYASTTLERQDGTTVTVSGFTDAQVRAALVLGQDAVVLTGVANLPTGSTRLSPTEYSVLAAASSSFLRFPVNAYSSGPSMTAGIATALSSGSWNLGLAGSLRYSGEFTPIVEDTADFSYQAGLEGRMRVGVDRLIGSSRLSFGVTVSSFSNDEFASGGSVTGVYHPGPRLIAEASYTALVGEWSLIGYAWNYHRFAGDSAGIPARNHENIVAAGTAGRIPLGRSISWEPGAEFRLTNPAEGKGVVLELGSTFRIRVNSGLSIVPSLRFDLGRIEEPPPGIGHAVRGIGLSVFVRESF